jgi:hypothetical protein
MNNREIAARFEQVADLLEFQNANPFGFALTVMGRGKLPICRNRWRRVWLRNG